MNKVLRTLTGLDRETPVIILLQQSGYLSVQQFTAYHTMMTMFKILKNKEPVNLYQKILQSKSSSDQLRNPATFHPRYKLATS